MLQAGFQGPLAGPALLKLLLGLVQVVLQILLIAPQLLAGPAQLIEPGFELIAAAGKVLAGLELGLQLGMAAQGLLKAQAPGFQFSQLGIEFGPGNG